MGIDGLNASFEEGGPSINGKTIIELDETLDDARVRALSAKLNAEVSPSYTYNLASTPNDLYMLINGACLRFPRQLPGISLLVATTRSL